MVTEVENHGDVPSATTSPCPFVDTLLLRGQRRLPKVHWNLRPRMEVESTMLASGMVPLSECQLKASTTPVIEEAHPNQVQELSPSEEKKMR